MNNVIDVTDRFPIPLVWPRLPMDLARVDAIAIHHTVTFYLSPDATESDEFNQILLINKYHKSKGFGGFGYHFIAFPSGRGYYVVPLTQWGAHVDLENGHLYGIAVAGDFSDTVPGLLQRGAVASAIQFIYAFLRRRTPIRPHRAWGWTSCPGGTWRAWVPGLIELVDGKEEDMERLNDSDAVAFHRLLVLFLMSKDPAHENVALTERVADLRRRVAELEAQSRADLKRGDSVIFTGKLT